MSLELGGESAAIVLEDADLSDAGEALFGATLLNNGQTCHLGTRVLAAQSRYDEVVETIAAIASSMPVGDALDPATMIGPMASSRHRDRVEGYIRAAREEGARLVTGGGRPDGRGWFVEPTVFADVSNDQTIAREEVFGPVLSIIPYDGEEDAIRIATTRNTGSAEASGPPTPITAPMSRDRFRPARSALTSTCPTRQRHSAASRDPASAASSALRDWSPISSCSPSICRLPAKAEGRQAGQSASERSMSSASSGWW